MCPLSLGTAETLGLSKVLTMAAFTAKEKCLLGISPHIALINASPESRPAVTANVLHYLGGFSFPQPFQAMPPAD